MNIALMIFGMALINLAIRYPVYLFADHVRFPRLIERALSFVPVAVLTAIIVPAVLFPHGDSIEFSWRNPFLLAAIVAAVVSRLTSNLLLATIGISMVAFLLLRWLLAGV